MKFNFGFKDIHDSPGSILLVDFIEIESYNVAPLPHDCQLKKVDSNPDSSILREVLEAKL